MFINISEHQKPTRHLSKRYIGTVVSNDDPKNLGRIKVAIPNLLEGETANLPWCVRKKGSTLGSSTSAGVWAVPKVGAKVEIEFVNEDQYFPEYTDAPDSTSSRPGSFSKDSIGIEAEGFSVSYDRQSKQFEIEHPTGTKVIIKPDGSVEISATIIKLNGEGGEVLTTKSTPYIDLITGAPSVGVPNVKAGV